MIINFIESIENTVSCEKISVEKINEGVAVAKKYDDYVELLTGIYHPSQAASPFASLSKFERTLVLKISHGEQNLHSVKKIIASDSFRNPEDLALHKILTEPKYYEAIRNVAAYAVNHYTENPVILRYIKETCNRRDTVVEELEEALEDTTIPTIVFEALEFWVESLAYYYPPEISNEYAEAFEEIRTAAITTDLIKDFFSDDTITDICNFILTDILDTYC